MAKSADARHLRCRDRKVVRVRFPPPAPVICTPKSGHGVRFSLAGEMRKRNACPPKPRRRRGRQEAGAALPFQDSKKRKWAGFKYKWSLATHSFLRNGEALDFVCACPIPPLRAQSSPPFLRNIVKRLGWLPLEILKKYWP